MLFAATDRYGSDIDVKSRLMDDGNEEESSGKIAALFGWSVSHNGGTIRSDGLEEDDIYIDFGDDTAEEISKEFDRRVKEAAKHGLYDKEVQKLRKAINEHNEIFKIRLGSGGPANVPPMKIVLDPTKKRATVKARRYPVDQQNLLDKYITKMSNMGFITLCLQASWQAAPDLVPKNSRSGFRTMIDLRPVKAAIKVEQWLSPIIEAELCDFNNSKYFASMDLVAGHWQCSLDPSSYDACGIVAPQGTFVSTRVLHGLKNASSYFQ